MIALTPKFCMVMASNLPEEEKMKIIEECRREFNNHPFVQLLRLFGWRRNKK